MVFRRLMMILEVIDASSQGQFAAAAAALWRNIEPTSNYIVQNGASKAVVSLKVDSFSSPTPRSKVTVEWHWFKF